MNFILKHKLTIIGVIAGAIGGYLYYHFVGCASGTCAMLPENKYALFSENSHV